MPLKIKKYSDKADLPAEALAKAGLVVGEPNVTISPHALMMGYVSDSVNSGEIAGEYKGEYMPEQALAVKTEKGLSVITGCAHPGIVTMVEKVKSEFPAYRIYSVFGGFHLMDKDIGIIGVTADKFKEMAIK